VMLPHLRLNYILTWVIFMILLFSAQTYFEAKW
jgi:hypothetical protein